MPPVVPNSRYMPVTITINQEVSSWTNQAYNSEVSSKACPKCGFRAPRSSSVSSTSIIQTLAILQQMFNEVRVLSPAHQ